MHEWLGDAVPVEGAGEYVMPAGQLTSNLSGRANRVAPNGWLADSAARGTFWGNRGCLLDDDGRLCRRWRGRNWLVCRLEYKGIRRTQWQPRRLTELYFLDEPTALAAGHRPCGKCRYTDYQYFRSAWQRGHSAIHVSASDIDRTLQADRLTRSGERRTFDADVSRLPDGTMFRQDGTFWLVRGLRVYRWSFEGYGGSRPRADFPSTVTVFTPRAIVGTLAAGYEPAYHPSMAVDIG